MALTDVAVKKAQLSDKQFKLSDEKGLYLLVNSAGEYWRMDYRYLGKRKTLALGVYPDEVFNIQAAALLRRLGVLV